MYRTRRTAVRSSAHVDVLAPYCDHDGALRSQRERRSSAWHSFEHVVVFLYGPPTNCYVAYTAVRRKIVLFICSASCAVYTVITRKIGFMYTASYLAS